MLSAENGKDGNMVRLSVVSNEESLFGGTVCIPVVSSIRKYHVMKNSQLFP